jgi:CHAT domain-containing protein
MGVHDDKTPWIPQEVKAVAAAVPNSILLLGDRSSENALRRLGPDSRLIHIATHGFFRADNPMFSWVRLGDSYLSLYDLYNLRLPVDLVTLSGCATGLNVVAAGDELLGLARGLLYAGAESLLLSLWDVHDRSTADFMSSFYFHLNNPQTTKASALRAAMMDVRHHYPHPFHWAPFLLIGSSA